MLAPAFYRRAIPAEARLSRRIAADGWPLRRFDWPGPGQTLPALAEEGLSLSKPGLEASARGAENGPSRRHFDKLDASLGRTEKGRTPRGSMLFQGGRGDMLEKYLEFFAHLHARGWSVSSLDWRGQGGSGRLSPDRHVGHCDDFGGLITDFEAFWDEWIRSTPGPHVVIGHSMGGHLLLRALLDGKTRPAAAVLVAPMLGLRSPVGARGGELAAELMTRVGNPMRAAWKQSERPGRHNRQALLTHDSDRYGDELWWRLANPELELGPPSWAWLAEAFRSTRHQRADPRLRTLDVPLLMLVALADQLVDPRAAQAVAAKLPDATVIEFGDEAAHELLREADPVRARAIAAIDSFLDARAPA